MLITFENKKKLEEETRHYHMSKLMYGTVGSFGFVTEADPGAETLINSGGKVVRERAKSAVGGGRR